MQDCSSFCEVWLQYFSAVGFQYFSYAGLQYFSYAGMQYFYERGPITIAWTFNSRALSRHRSTRGKVLKCTEQHFTSAWVEVPKVVVLMIGFH